MSTNELPDAVERASDSTPPSEAPGGPAPPPVAPQVVRRGGRLTWLLAMLIGLTLVAASPLWLEEIQYSLTRGEQRAKADVARAELANLTDATSARFRLVAQSVEPSVVHIDSYRPRVEESPVETLALPFPLRRSEPLWRDGGTGSGVIVDGDGYVLTNFHVIDGAERIDIQLADGRTIRNARLVGDDPLTDLALLKIDARGLTPTQWGESRELEVGDWVMAVGNPFGLDRTATVGIISAKRRRDIFGATPFQDFLQTDAAVNPGNSGGPLVDAQGRLIGITTAIVGRTYRGISFAIPSEIAREVYDQLRREGRVPRAWLGVELADDSTTDDEIDIGRVDGGGDRRGALVRETVRGAPAAEAGIRRGDWIVRFNDRDIAGRTDLSRTVAQSRIGSEARVTLLRDGQPQEVTVRLRERP